MDLPSANDMRRVASGARRASHNPAFDYALRKLGGVVKEAARQRHLSVAYELPEFVHGCPSFKVADCMEYVTAVMEGKGYDVNKLGEKVLVVSWEPVQQAPAPRGGTHIPVTNVFEGLTL